MASSEFADPPVTPEHIAEAKANDDRYRVIDLALEMRAELADSKALILVLNQAQREEDDAIKAFMVVNPADAVQVANLQAIVYRNRFIRATLSDLFEAAQNASDSLDAETQEREHGRED